MASQARTAIYILFGLFLASAFEYSRNLDPSEGEIHGIVVDSANRPVPKVRVYLHSAKPGPAGSSQTLIPNTDTDSNGLFAFLHCDLGHYLLGTEWEEGGYGNTSYDFYRTGPPTLVQIDATHYHVNER